MQMGVVLVSQKEPSLLHAIRIDLGNNTEVSESSKSVKQTASVRGKNIIVEVFFLKVPLNAASV